MTGNQSQKRLYWKCRRGMLELDLLFMRFLEKEYPSLTPEQQQTFEQLLEEDDPDLYAYFMGQEKPQDKAHQDMIDYINARFPLHRE